MDFNEAIAGRRATQRYGPRYCCAGSPPPFSLPGRGGKPVDNRMQSRRLQAFAAEVATANNGSAQRGLKSGLDITP
ncbi:hypothetical protein [Pollutimonas bauzanensis]|uniref:hypothetical protein n=1 Tax=Pollutimonas bauzanensis TaxID=658167 RepID=UPI0011606989|nr:hypothetical protein [Pollutimonas bauzanensis]